MTLSIVVLVIVAAAFLTRDYKSRETPQTDGSWKSGVQPYQNKDSDFDEKVK
jgi:hypothetical protein